MCGIYGYRTRTGVELTVFETTVLSTVLAREMENRGRDSWGGVVFKGDHAEIFKGVGRITANAHQFLRAASVGQTILAHTRAATVGKISKDNSHPFLIGDVLGVHNGSIYNYTELNKKYDRNYEVDSQQIFAHLNSGLDLSEVEGQGTFIFSRSTEAWKNIYIARTVGSSLFVGRFYRDSKHHEHFATVWASEERGVRIAADLVGAYLTEVRIDPNKLYKVGSDGDVYNTDSAFELKTRVISSITGWPQNYWEDHTAEPIKQNLVKHTTGSCAFCGCDLAKHKHNMCGDNRFQHCKSRMNEKCFSRILKSCRDCGHYLVDGIHDEVENKVNCVLCKKVCEIKPPNTYNNGATKADFIKPAVVAATDNTDSDVACGNVVEFFGLPSKKEQKRIAKKAKKATKKAWDTETVDPLPKNIRAIDSVPKYFTVSARNAKDTIVIPMCLECCCDLDDHIWGWCQNNGMKKCKSKTAKGKCITNIPLCRDCGCHMVEGIHTETPIHDQAIWCLSCNTYCASSVDEPDLDGNVKEDVEATI